MEESSRPPPGAAPRGGDWKRRFLRALGRYGNVSVAARKAKVSPSTIYRAKSSDPKFAAALMKAKEQAVESLEDTARSLAKEGNAQMLMFLLKAHRPGRYRDGESDADGLHTNPEGIDGSFISERVLADARFRHHIREAMRIISGEVQSGGARAPGDAGGMDSRPALEPPQ